MIEKYQFNHKLAQECARAFSAATGLGCTVSDTKGTTLFEYGKGCGSCDLCQVAGLSQGSCAHVHIYGMTEAERFGGKYIYFCPLGLTCFVSPIIGDARSEAKITVGPFLMVELQDFIDCELTENFRLEESVKAQVVSRLGEIPFVPPNQVQDLSVLLFMAVGFLNNVSAENQLLETEHAQLLQQQISAYIAELKASEAPPRYPFEKERQLLQAISQCDIQDAYLRLKELLAALLAIGGGNLNWIAQRAGELVVLISRAAVENGVAEDQALYFIQYCQKVIPTKGSFHALSAWLYDAVTDFLGGLFVYPDAKHSAIIHQCTRYIGANYANPITLDEMAKAVNLSPDYLSRIFRLETGSTFNQYLTHVRISKAKELIRRFDFRLTDISLMVGYDDQSYFTKVFKRIVGMSPSEYAKKTATVKKSQERRTE